VCARCTGFWKVIFHFTIQERERYVNVSSLDIGEQFTFCHMCVSFPSVTKMVYCRTNLGGSFGFII